MSYERYTTIDKLRDVIADLNDDGSGQVAHALDLLSRIDMFIEALEDDLADAENYECDCEDTDSFDDGPEVCDRLHVDGPVLTCVTRLTDMIFAKHGHYGEAGEDPWIHSLRECATAVSRLADTPADEPTDYQAVHMAFNFSALTTR